METVIRGIGAANLGAVERWVSVTLGTVLAGHSFARNKRSLALVILGAELLRRGITGRSFLYRFLGISSLPRENWRKPIPYRQGIRIDESLTIQKRPEEVYLFWRGFENLPYFMEHLVSVSLIDGSRSHWVAKARSGEFVEWDAEIISDTPNKMISWRSLPGSEVVTAGSVNFSSAPGNRGTEVRVELQYLPRGGILAAFAGKFFGESPGKQVREDLRHLKQILEAGEVPTTRGQPVGSGLRERAAREKPARGKLGEQAA